MPVSNSKSINACISSPVTGVHLVARAFAFRLCVVMICVSIGLLESQVKEVIIMKEFHDIIFSWVFWDMFWTDKSWPENVL